MFPFHYDNGKSRHVRIRFTTKKSIRDRDRRGRSGKNGWKGKWKWWWWNSRGGGKISEEQRIVARYSPRGNGIGVIVDRSLAKPLSPLNMAVYGESRFSKTSDEGER